MDGVRNFYLNLQKCYNLKVPDQLEYFKSIEWLETEYKIDIEPVFHGVGAYHRDVKFCEEFKYKLEVISLVVVTACVAMPILNYAWKRYIRPRIQNISIRKFG